MIPFCQASLGFANLGVFFSLESIVWSVTVSWCEFKDKSEPSPHPWNPGEASVRDGGIKSTTRHHSLKCVFFTLQLPNKSALFSFHAHNAAESTWKIKPRYSNEFHCALKMWLCLGETHFKSELLWNGWCLARYKTLGYLEKQTGNSPTSKHFIGKLTHYRYRPKVDFQSTS